MVHDNLPETHVHHPLQVNPCSRQENKSTERLNSSSSQIRRIIKSESAENSLLHPAIPVNALLRLPLLFYAAEGHLNPPMRITES